MNVLLDSVIFGLQRFGGISQYWNEMSLRLLAKRELKISQRLPRKLLGDYTAIRAIPTSSIDSIETSIARYMPIAPREKHVDLVHTSYYRMTATPTLNLICTVYDFTYEFQRVGFARKVHSLQKSLAMRRSQGLIFISDSTRNDALKLYPDLASKRLAVINLASDPSVFFVDSRPRLCLPDGLDERDYVLFVGQRSGYKRFDLVIEAVALIPGLTLVAVGSPLNEAERSQISRALEGRWVVRANVANEELRLLYTYATCFIYPSDYEGFGLPILDAMACGCPVICADRSSFPEVAGDAALMIHAQQAESYACAIVEVRRADIRADLRARGLARSKRFSWEDMAARTLDFYSEFAT